MIAFCEKAGKKYKKMHPQHKEPIYARFVLEDEVADETAQSLQSTLKKSSKIEDTEDQSSLGSDSSDKSSNSSEESSSDSDDDRNDRSSPPLGRRSSSSAEVSQELCQNLGRCITVKSQFKGFNSDKDAWLKPWAHQLETLRRELEDAELAFKNAMTAGDGKKT